MVNNANTGRQELNPCPLCDGSKKKGYLVCANCHKIYVDEAAACVLRDETPLTKEEWGEQKIRERLPQLAKEVHTAQNHRDICKKLKAQKIEGIFRTKIKGQSLGPDVLDRVREKIEETDGKKIWAEVGGNRVVRELRIAEERFQEAKRLLDDLMAKKSETKKEEPSILAETVEILQTPEIEAGDNSSKPRKKAKINTKTK